MLYSWRDGSNGLILCKPDPAPNFYSKNRIRFDVKKTHPEYAPFESDQIKNIPNWVLLPFPYERTPNKGVCSPSFHLISSPDESLIWILLSYHPIVEEMVKILYKIKFSIIFYTINKAWVEFLVSQFNY